jgi:DNA-3-methyladenine glycosylase II
VLVRVPQPYDFELSTARYRLFGSDGATVWNEGGVHRVVAGRERRIVAARGGVHIEPGDREAAAEAGHLLGLPLDLEPFRAWAASEPVLGPIVARLDGFRPTLNPQPFEALVVAITTQQISLRAAAAIRGRFVQRFGVRHEIASEFPTRERIACARPSDITAIGFSGKKAEYVVSLARSDLDLDALARVPDDEVIETLTAVPGLGRWTAD